MKDEKLPLKVLDASAGSGKTFQLVLEYLELVLRKTDPASFDQIVAMTFTNKAAFEMKERIISALESLAYESQNSKLTDILRVNLSLTGDELKQKSRDVLLSILHNYEDFNVLTIDKFNLRLIKSFSKDLDLPADFEIIMNEEELIERVVDKLLDKLGKAKNDELDKIIFEYAKQNLDDESKWNFKDDLIEFGLILKREKDLDKIVEISKQDFSLEKYAEIRAEKFSIEKGYNEILLELKVLLNRFPLDQDLLPGKSKTYDPIQKLLLNSYPRDKCLSLTVRKYCEQDLKPGQEFNDNIRLKLIELDDYWSSQFENHTRIVLFLKNFFNMALLQHISEELNVARHEEHVIRISEFNQLIKELIQKEKALFIYERLGNRFHHFLLDEFQDTSRLQWLNLVPLIHEALSTNKKNLIVGDPKQSIYRFKNGVAEQFVSLPAIYNPEEDKNIAELSHYFNSRGEKIPLAHNWRSAKNIVEFNNSFFEELKLKMPRITQNFYSSITQIPNSKNIGGINIRSQEVESIKDEQLVPEIVAFIKECIESGYKQGDICILGEKNHQCNIWARGLTKLGYKVVSADSLLLKSSVKVNLCIAYLQLLLHRNDQHRIKHFAELYFRVFHNKITTSYFDFIVEESIDNRTFRNFDLNKFVAHEFGDSNLFFPAFENLFHLVQHMFGILKLHELSDPFLHHFADFVYQFELKKGPDLNGLLQEYKLKEKNLALQIPESSDAIQIMTIHKSKGLEFPIVIIPSMNFNKSKVNEHIIKIGDYLIYKKPIQSDKLNELKEVLQEEMDQVYTDCVNKCYVALTRPVDRIYILNYHQKSSFGSDFHNALSQVTGKPNSDEIEFIEESSIIKIQNMENDQYFQPQDLNEFLWFPDIALQDKSELLSNDYFNEQQHYGRQFHYLISNMHNSDDLDDIISQGILKGFVDAEIKDSLKLDVLAAFTNKQYSELFNDADQIMYEQTILVDEKTTLRPDLIITKPNETLIIDYKTGEPTLKDEKQVLQYIHLMKSMNYKNVKGFLYYVRSLTIKEV